MPRELKLPLPPMEALPVDDPPEGQQWQYEPKVFYHGGMKAP